MDCLAAAYESGSDGSGGEGERHGGPREGSRGATGDAVRRTAFLVALPAPRNGGSVHGLPRVSLNDATGSLTRSQAQKRRAQPLRSSTPTVHSEETEDFPESEVAEPYPDSPIIQPHDDSSEHHPVYSSSSVGEPIEVDARLLLQGSSSASEEQGRRATERYKKSRDTEEKTKVNGLFRQPTGVQKRRHQINQLANDVIRNQVDLEEKRNSQFSGRNGARSKYGW